jgi:hypothetical protein
MFPVGRIDTDHPGKSVASLANVHSQGDFTGPQPACRRQRQHRIVGPATGRTPVNGRQDLFDVIPADRSGDGSVNLAHVDYLSS